MKAIVFILLILTCILQVKAQQITITPKNNSPLNYGVKPDPSWKNLIQPDKDSIAPINITPDFKLNQTAAVTYDRMPVARLNNNDRMPVVQTDRTGYTMPVAGMNLSEVYNMKKPDDVKKPVTP